MAGFIFKPSTRKGPVFLSPTDAGSPPTITLANGTVITAVRGDKAGGTFAGHDGYQYVFPREVLGQKGAKLSYAGQTQELADTNMSYRGGALGSLTESSKGAIGSADFGNLTPGNIGFGSTIADLSSEFPTPTLLNYKGNPGNFEFTDPMAFAEKFGDFNRDGIRKNFNISSDIALKELDLELAGMKSFVPAASALKRSELSLDNAFNQAERTKQVDTALPGARRQLNEQAQRAETYARGEVPDSVTDRALELGIRSDAADLATAGGFGANSRLSGKISDLMSAKERIGLSQYGDQLLGTNIDRSANLFLAPTAYSDAGQQVKVTPSVDLGTRTANNLTQLNSETLINPTNALSTAVNQRQFNASNRIGVDQFNVNTKNTFKQNLFNYKVGLAGQYAGASQTDINTNLALQQQEQNKQIYQDYLKKGQKSQDVNSITQLISGLSSLFGSGGALNDLVSGNDGTTTTNGTQVPQFSGETDTSSPPEYPSDAPSTPEVSTSDTATAQQGRSAYSDTPVERAAGLRVNNIAGELGAGKRMAAVSSKDASAAIKASEGVSKVAGIHTTQVPGSVFVGNNSQGQPIYADQALLKSNDTNTGNAYINTLKGVLDPLKVFEREDSTTLDKIGTVASDTNLLNNLSLLYKSGDKKGFISLLGTKLGNSAIKNADLSPKDKAGLAGVLTAYNLYENWDRMSGAQKSLGIASLGIQSYRYAGSGKDLAAREIIKPTAGSPGLNVGQALDLFSAGVNVYSLVKDWDQYSTFQKVALGTGTAAQVAQTAKSLNLLGAGTSNAVVPGVTAQSLSAAGFTAVPEAGVGAITGSASSAVPAGYTVVAKDAATNTVTAVPTGLESSFAEGLQIAGGVASVALGTKAVIDGWQGSGKSGVVNGAVGGSMIASGMYALGATNPYLLGAVVATSIVADSTGGKKSVDQKSRDAARDTVVNNGLADKDYKITLADGSKFDIGVDGHGQQFNYRDPSKLVDKGRVGKKANAYDVDYTNDLDYAASMGGIALSRLLHGGTGKAIDQLGGQLTNAAISSVGHGKDMTKENFEKIATNLKGMYSKAGIKSKADAYQIANRAFAEKRINDTELVAMHQAFNMMFDKDGFNTAQKLMGGRFQGVNAVKDGKPEKQTETPSVETPTVSSKGPKRIELTKEEIRARNAAKYRQAKREQELRAS